MPRRYVPRALRGQVAGKKGGRPTAEPRTPSRPSAPPEPPTPAEPTEPAVPVGAAEDTLTVRPAAPARRRPSPRPRPTPVDDEPEPPAKPGTNGADPDLSDTGSDVTGTSSRRPAKAPVRAPARPSSSVRGGRRPATRKRGKSGKTAATPKAERVRLAAKRRAIEQRRLHQLRVASVVLAVIVLLGAAGTAVTWWRTASHDAVGTASDEAIGTAQSATPALLSYDYKHFDASVQNASRYISGSFLTEYRNNMAALKKQAVKLKAKVTAKVTATGVVSADHDTVVLLVFVDQYRKNSNIDGQKVDQDRVVLTMKHLDNGWKVAKLIAV
jgi:Mce-associated membrane protein